MKSDKAWIEKHMARLPAHHQKIAADKYQDLFLGGYPSGRNPANEFLLRYADEHGVSKQEMTKAAKDAVGRDRAWLEERIRQLQKAREDSKPKIIK